MGRLRQKVRRYPLGFLHLSLGRAREEVVKLGLHLSVESRPRATCALCLVQDSAAYWAHVGDSRIYQLRQQQVLERTRDHSQARCAPCASGWNGAR